MIQLSKAHVAALRFAVGYSQPPHDTVNPERDGALTELSGMLRRAPDGPLLLVEADVLTELNPNGRAFR